MMDPITAKAVWGLFHLWRLLARVVWPVVQAKRADRKRDQERRELREMDRYVADYWEQERRQAAVIAKGRGWTMREVDE